MSIATLEAVADNDLLAAAAALERELDLLEHQHNALVDRLNGPWNELRAIGGLPEADLRRSLADEPAAPTKTQARRVM